MGKFREMAAALGIIAGASGCAGELPKVETPASHEMRTSHEEMAATTLRKLFSDPRLLDYKIVFEDESYLDRKKPEDIPQADKDQWTKRLADNNLSRKSKTGIVSVLWLDGPPQELVRLVATNDGKSFVVINSQNTDLHDRNIQSPRPLTVESLAAYLKEAEKAQASGLSTIEQ